MKKVASLTESRNLARGLHSIQCCRLVRMDSTDNMSYYCRNVINPVRNPEPQLGLQLVHSTLQVATG